MGGVSAAVAEVGARLRAAGFPDGDPVLRTLFVEGGGVPRAAALAALPAGAWSARLVHDDHAETVASGRIQAEAGALLWSDTPERAVRPFGVPAPDAIDADLCAALPTRRVRRHLDIGGGAGQVALHAAASAREVVALEPRERCHLAQWRSIALSGLSHVSTAALEPVDAASTGTFQRLTARLSLEDLALLPHVLDDDGIALVWVPGADADAVVGVLHDVFTTRPWAGRWRPGGRGGLLLLQADGGPAWGRVPAGAALGPDTTLAWLGG